jgi:regulator of replication initiation timing
VTESPIVAWLTGAAVNQAIAKAAKSLAEGKSEDVIAQVASLVEENALLKSDNAVLRNENASLSKRLDKVRAELDAIKRAVARGAEQRGLRVQQPSEHHRRDSRQGVRPYL